LTVLGFADLPFVPTSEIEAKLTSQSCEIKQIVLLLGEKETLLIHPLQAIDIKVYPKEDTVPKGPSVDSESKSF